MPRNRFEQVNEPQADAITLSLLSRGGERVGTVTCPASISGGSLPADVTSGEMSDVEAFRSAIRLANTVEVPVVVVDPQGLWNPAWGDLAREVAS